MFLTGYVSAFPNNPSVLSLFHQLPPALAKPPPGLGKKELYFQTGGAHVYYFGLLNSHFQESD